MALITIILSLLLDRTLCILQDIRDLSWFELYTQTVSNIASKAVPKSISKKIKIGHGWIKLSAVLILPLTIIILTQLAVTDLLYGALYFVFGLLVLFYCLGPTCQRSDIDAYLDARSLGDDDEALHYAGIITEQIASTTPDQQTDEVTRAIISTANERSFSTLLWFVVLGPVGAVLYRLVTNISKQEEADVKTKQSARIIAAAMAWVPARMLALGYALTGHFDGAIQAYRSRTMEKDLKKANNEVLISTGMGALRHQRMSDEISCIRSARDLVMRSIIIWIAVLALLTLGGWLS
jgi:AmpE protein